VDKGAREDGHERIAAKALLNHPLGKVELHEGALNAFTARSLPRAVATLRMRFASYR
jgi:hypothetical protein